MKKKGKDIAVEGMFLIKKKKIYKAPALCQAQQYALRERIHNQKCPSFKGEEGLTEFCHNRGVL